MSVSRSQGCKLFIELPSFLFLFLVDVWSVSPTATVTVKMKRKQKALSARDEFLWSQQWQTTPSPRRIVSLCFLCYLSDALGFISIKLLATAHTLAGPLLGARGTQCVSEMNECDEENVMRFN